MQHRLLCIVFLLGCGGPSTPAKPVESEESRHDPLYEPEPIEYSGIHWNGPEGSLFFTDYRCDPSPEHPGFELTFGDTYKSKLAEHQKAGSLVRVDVRFRGVLSPKGSFGPQGRSPHQVRVLELLEMGEADVCKDEETPAPKE